MAKPKAFAVAAHPDDIELMMGGTLALLAHAGYETHYMNIANGSMGTVSETRETIVAERTEEARAAATTLGAIFHKPLVDDLDIFYDRVVVRRLVAVVRDIEPRIVLVQSPQDYMEDHTNSCRLAVSASFFGCMKNFISDPPRPIVKEKVTVYHALPWGLHDPLRRLLRAGQYVDVSSVLQVKRDALACHKSQKEWLDKSQGLDSYLATMEEMTYEVGRMSGRFKAAEGWRRHFHLGFCGPNDDPLCDALGDLICVSEEYEAGLNR